MSFDSQSTDFNIDIPSWVNRPYNEAKSASRTASRTSAPAKSANVSHSIAPKKRSTIDRTLDYDTLEISRPRKSHGKKKKSYAGLKAGAVLTATLTLCTAGLAKCGNDKPVTDSAYSAAYMTPYSESSSDVDILEKSGLVYDEPNKIVSPVGNTSDSSKTEDIAGVEESEETETKEDKEAKQLLEKFEETGGDAWDEFDNLCNIFDLTKEEMAKKLIFLCEDEEWGKNYVDPILLCAQMYQESSYDANKIGDGGEALGLGQFHECAVDDVNRVFGTNYKYTDRSNPKKALEMMVLYLRYCHVQAGSTDAMLAMYNAGHKDAIEHQYGKDYVKKVYSRINQTPNV